MSAQRPLRAIAVAVVLLAILGGSRAAIPRDTLHSSVLTEGLPALVAGAVPVLTLEARRVVLWASRTPAPLFLDKAGRKLRGTVGETHALSSEMTAALLHFDQWYRLEASKDRPVTQAELSAAALDPRSVGIVRVIFERAIARAARIGDRIVIPESGGEATIDGSLNLVESTDDRWPLVLRLASLADSPERLAGMTDEEREATAHIDAHGLLANALERFRLRFPGAREEVARAVETVVLNSGPTFEMTLERQVALIVSHEWNGRYVGRWHTHGPRWTRGGLVGGQEPSFEDMGNALRDGQFLTIAFHAEGFDLYDASALGDTGRVDLSLLRVTRHRAKDWKEHFDRILKRSPGPLRSEIVVR